MACAPDASLRHLRQLLAVVWLDKGGVLSLGGAVGICAPLAGLEWGQEEPEPSTVGEQSTEGMSGAW